MTRLEVRKVRICRDFCELPVQFSGGWRTSANKGERRRPCDGIGRVAGLLIDWEQSNPYPFGFDHDDCAGIECFGELFEVVEERCGLICGSALFSAEQYDAWKRMVSQRDEFAEVRVCRDNHAFLYPSELEELGVGSTTSLQIGDNMDCVMAGGVQRDGDAMRQASSTRNFTRFRAREAVVHRRRQRRNAASLECRRVRAAGSRR